MATVYMPIRRPIGLNPPMSLDQPDQRYISHLALDQSNPISILTQCNRPAQLLPLFMHYLKSPLFAPNVALDRDVASLAGIPLSLYSACAVTLVALDTIIVLAYLVTTITTYARRA